MWWGIGSSRKLYVFWDRLIVFLFCFCSQAYENRRWCTIFFFVSYAFRLATGLEETTTHGECNVHACMQSEPSDVCFLFCFCFLFFLFQGEKEERSGRLSGEGLNTYLPTSLPTWLY